MSTGRTQGPGGREVVLAAALDRFVLGHCGDQPLDGSDDPDWSGSLAVLELIRTLQWDAAAAFVRSLPAVPAADVEAGWLRQAVTVWAAAGDPAPDSDAVLAGLMGPAGPAGLDDLPDPRTPVGRVAGHLLVEGVLAHARLDLAASIVDRLGDGLWADLFLGDRDGGDPHPFGLMAQMCRVRLLAFRGELSQADAVLSAIGEPPDGPLAALVAGTTCLVRGNEADPAEVRRLVCLVDQHALEVHDLVGAGSHLLAAFGQIAVGDVAGAARRVLLAGGDAGLERLDVIDRALGLEMLTAFAVAADDLDAAQTWAHQAMALVSSPIADSTLARLLSRVALAEGRVPDAVAWGERAVCRAREVERVIEYTEGEIVLNRARLLQRSEGCHAAAARALEAMVAEAEQRGHSSARRSASRELRPVGLRLRPLAGSGWTGLSARESEVARCVVEGASNREVALRLHVSEHTVRAHVSRVLAAFGVATRAALPGVAGSGPGRGAGLPSLTPRQEEVARLVAGGLSNRSISDALGLSTRTVEKHVGDILVRWDLTGRTAIAREMSRRA